MSEENNLSELDMSLIEYMQVYREYGLRVVEFCSKFLELSQPLIDGKECDYHLGDVQDMCDEEYQKMNYAKDLEDVKSQELISIAYKSPDRS